MSKNNIIIALVVLCLVGTIWGSVQDKKSDGLERQLAAMKEQSHTAVGDEAADDGNGAALDAALAEVEELKGQNQTLLDSEATVKETVGTLRHELASLKKELAEADNSQALEAMQAQRAKRDSRIAGLEETIVAVRAELDDKSKTLASLEEAASGLEDVKSSLANRVDAYSEKNQELSAALEAVELRVTSLGKALEERTKLLVNKGKELSRTKLNMDVLLSKIAVQNNSLAILEETRVALEKELANKFLIIEELQHQQSAQVVVDAVIEEKHGEEGVEQEEKAAPAEEVPAH